MTIAQDDSLLMSESSIAQRVLVQEYLAHEHLAKQGDATDTAATKPLFILKKAIVLWNENLELSLLE